MLTFLEILLSLTRIIILIVGLLLSVLLGDSLYSAINTFLASHNFPCLGLISSLVIGVPFFMVLYGQHIQKYFWQRQKEYNIAVLVAAFTVGVIFTFLPLDSTFSLTNTQTLDCSRTNNFNAGVVHILGTGLVTAFLAYLSMDFGVGLKQMSLQIRNTTSVKKKKRK